MFYFIKSVLALAVLAALVVSALPMSWRHDCDICGEYVDACRKFTVRKGDPNVMLRWDCNITYKQHDSGHARYQLERDEVGFRLVPTAERIINRTDADGRPIVGRSWAEPNTAWVRPANKTLGRGAPVGAIDEWQVNEISASSDYFGRSQKYVRTLARD